MTLRIGVDVGGTNTDAVLLDGRTVLSWTKQATTPDVTGGIRAAIAALLEERQCSPADVGALMLGTTHFTNAVLERRNLARTALVRLCLPATVSIPPLFDWPADLLEAIGGSAHLIHGGLEYDGAPIGVLQDSEIDSVVERLREEGVEALALAGVFSPVDAGQEHEAARRLSTRLPQLPVTLSSEIGRIGLLERENAATLNACLHRVASTVLGSLDEVLQQLGLSCPLYVSQNDGTLMTAVHARRYPVLTFASGPTNSMRGAALLSELNDAIVVDIGGTSSDMGVLRAGFPREASFEVSIGGVRTNFRMPDVLSLALGGGSIVACDGARVGPRSTGHEITRLARVFGGEVLTATDIAVAAGLVELGERARLSALPPAIVSRALATMHEALEQGIDAVKTSASAMPVVVVGGGSFLASNNLAGAAEVIRPPYFQVANAVGAAIAQVSGEIDRVFPLEGRDRTAALAEAQDAAKRRAIDAGAETATLEIVEVEETPVAYLPSTAIRIRVKAVGDLHG